MNFSVTLTETIADGLMCLVAGVAFMIFWVVLSKRKE